MKAGAGGPQPAAHGAAARAAVEAAAGDRQREHESVHAPAIPPPPPRTNWTRLVLPPVLGGHVYSHRMSIFGERGPLPGAGARLRGAGKLPLEAACPISTG